MLALPYNEKREHTHIFQAVISEYPKVKAYIEKMFDVFNYWIISYKFEKKPVLGYWNFRGMSSALRYQLIYSGVDFEMKRYMNGDEWKEAKPSLGMNFPNLPYFTDGDL